MPIAKLGTMEYNTSDREVIQHGGKNHAPSGADRRITDSRVAIVTGASRGIGAEVARQLARTGMFVVVNYINTAGAAEQVVDEIRVMAGAADEKHSPAAAVRADVSNKEDVRRLFDEAERVYGGVDVLVVNAGVQAMGPSPLGGTDDETFNRLIDVNFRGAFYLLREASNRLRDGGSIIAVSSSAIGLRVPGQAVYNACKAGLEVMSTLLAGELRCKNITVNVVAPGPTETELFLQRTSDKTIEHLTQQTPLGRIGRPADIASVITFLTGDDGRWINGQVIRANGGLV